MLEILMFNATEFTFSQHKNFAIPTSALTIVVNEIIDSPQLVALKTIKAWSMQSKTPTYLFTFLLHVFL